MSPKFPVLTGDETVRILQRAGFEIKREKGSRVHLFRQSDGRRSTVPVHRGQSLPIGTLRSILKDADLTIEEVLKLR